MRNTLSTLVHARAKAGKSTLMSTAPTPICTFDVEGSWKFIRTQGFNGPAMRKIYWNPQATLPPEVDPADRVAVIIDVRDWNTLQYGYAQLVQSPHTYRSVIVDSVTEAQRKLKANLRGLEQMRIQDWGDLLTHMDKWIRDVRDLTLIPNLPIEFVGFVAETEMGKSGKWVPAMQGQIGRALPYWIDIVGYLRGINEMDANGQPTKRVKELIVTADHPEFEAGERVQGLLGDSIIEPNFSDIYRAIWGHEAPTPGTSPTTITVGGNE